MTEKQQLKCIVCGSEYFRFLKPGITSRFCSKQCRYSFQKESFKGASNPNFKKGNWCLESYCKCGGLKDARAIECINCRSVNLDIDIISQEIKKYDGFQSMAKGLGLERTTITNFVKQNNIDFSHFKHGRGRPITNEKLFSVYTTTESRRNWTVKNRIKEENILPVKCSECGLGEIWNNKPISIELDHINGNKYDNRLENLRFLCPNCHTQQPTSRGKNYHKYKG